LDRRSRRLGDQRHVPIIVMSDRFFDPVDPFVVEREGMPHGVRERQCLVEIHHQPDRIR
jgi:hypothetical protein